MPKHKHEEEKAAKAVAKEEEKAETVKLTEREVRWMAFLEAHKKQNPEKHATRLAEGKFKTIPDSFV